jgi:hypothetical protein
MWLKNNWFKVSIVLVIIFYFFLLKAHYRAECVAELTMQDGKSNGILRLDDACKDLGFGI